MKLLRVRTLHIQDLFYRSFLEFREIIKTDKIFPFVDYHPKTETFDICYFIFQSVYSILR